MKILILVTIILKIIPDSVVQGIFQHRTSEFADLIMDIKKLYRATTVMLVHGIQMDNLEDVHFIFKLSRMLLRRNATILTESIDEVTSSEEYYKGHIGRPLIVVFLTTRTSVKMFEAHARNLNLVEPFWLIIFLESNEKPLYEYCQHPIGNPFHSTFNSELLIKCYEDKNIYEWYSVYKNKTEVRRFATWDSINRLNLTGKRELYLRRTQIGGVSFRVASVKNAPQYKGVPRLMYKMVQALSDVLNFTLKYKIGADGLGSWNYTSREWSGVMRQIDKGEVDMAIFPMTMTSKRLESVDFSQPLILARTFLYIKEPRTISVKWVGLFQTFDEKVWYSILAFVLVTPLLLTFIKLKINDGNITETQLLYDSYFSVWRIYCQQGLTELVSSSSLKLAYFSIFMSSWIIISLYSAYLISYLTLPAPTLPFKDIEGFLADGTYKLIVLQHSAEYDLFEKTNDPILKKMKSLMKKTADLPINGNEALEQVCNEKVAFCTNEAKKNSIKSIPCSLVKITTGRIDSIALTINKYNQYLGVIKFHLQRFLDNGMINRLKRKYLTKIEQLPTSQHVAVGLQGVAPILVIISGGLGLAFLILFFEKLYFFFTCKRKRNVSLFG